VNNDLPSFSHKKTMKWLEV